MCKEHVILDLFVGVVVVSDFALSKFSTFNAWNTVNFGKLQTDGTCKN